MKYALITDTHFGVRNDSQILLEYQKKFYDEIFFPYLDKNDIKHIVHLGDLVDRRKSINFYTLNNLKDCFLSPALERNISIDLIVGNHDMYYKNTNQINALNELCGDLEGVDVYNNPTTTLLGTSGIEVCYVPWVCTENEKETFDELENTSAQLVLINLIWYFLVIFIIRVMTATFIIWEIPMKLCGQITMYQRDFIHLILIPEN